METILIILSYYILYYRHLTPSALLPIRSRLEPTLVVVSTVDLHKENPNIHRVVDSQFNQPGHSVSDMRITIVEKFWTTTTFSEWTEKSSFRTKRQDLWFIFFVSQPWRPNPLGIEWTQFFTITNTGFTKLLYHFECRVGARYNTF